MVKLSCNDINRNIEDFCYLQDCIDMSSCSCCHMMCRSSFAPTVYKLSCTTCETCSHVCITKGKDRSFFINTFRYNKFEVSISILKTISGTGQLSEMYSIDFNEDICIIGHSGSGDADISDKKPTMKIVPVFHGKTGGGYSLP